MPTMEEREAFKKVYDHYGCDKVLDNDILLYNALGDILGADGKKLRNQLKIALDAGINKAYKQQLSNPTDDFDSRIISIMVDAGLSEASASNIKELYDYMVGKEALQEGKIAAGEGKSDSANSEEVLSQNIKPIHNGKETPSRHRGIIPIICLLIILLGVGIYFIAISSIGTTEYRAGDVLSNTDPFVVGDYVTFGTYPQTENFAIKQPIEWQVVDRNEKAALLVSRYGIEAKEYHTSNGEVTWANCSLRAWLNADFLESAFTTQEQSDIVEVEIDNSATQDRRNNGIGPNTQDRIFLLSYAEAVKYFDVYDSYGYSDGSKGTLKFTEHALQAYGWTSYETDTGAPWWLRSPGDTSWSNIQVDAVDEHGRVSFNYITNKSLVRPAMWVNLDAVVNQNSQIETDLINASTEIVVMNSSTDESKPEIIGFQLADPLRDDMVGYSIRFKKNGLDGPFFVEYALGSSCYSRRVEVNDTGEEILEFVDTWNDVLIPGEEVYFDISAGTEENMVWSDSIIVKVPITEEKKLVKSLSVQNFKYSFIENMVNQFRDAWDKYVSVDYDTYKEKEQQIFRSFNAELLMKEEIDSLRFFAMLTYPNGFTYNSSLYDCTSESLKSFLVFAFDWVDVQKGSYTLNLYDSYERCLIGSTTFEVY